MLILILKWIHIISAIVALGANLTYPIWLSRVKNSPTALLFTLRTIRFIDNLSANPAYMVALITGFAMIHISKIPITTPWILAPLIIFAVVGLLGGLYTLTLKKQIALAEKSGSADPAYQKFANRGNVLGLIIFILVFAIVYIMVAKPQLW